MEFVCQKKEKQWLIEVPEVPAMGFKTIYFQPFSDTPKTEKFFEKDEFFSMNLPLIETPFYTILLNDRGQFLSIFDKEEEREILEEGKAGNVFQVFEDKPLAHDAWDIDIFYQQKMREITELESMEVISQGPIQAVIRMKWKYMNSRMEQEIVFYRKDRRIDFKTYVDWHEHHQLLKVAFPVDIRATYGTYDVQYGNVQRPTHWNTSWDWVEGKTVQKAWALN